MAEEFKPTGISYQNLISGAIPASFLTQSGWLKELQKPVRETETQISAAPDTSQAETSKNVESPPAQQPVSAPTVPQENYGVPTGGQIGLQGYVPNPRILDIYSKIFNPMQQKLATQYGELGSSVNKFNLAAGMPRTWEGIGGEGTIESALGSLNAEPIRNLLASRYTGPTSLEGMDALISPYQDLMAKGRGLGSTSGLATVLGQISPGMSMGERRFSAQKVAPTKEYKQSAEGMQKDIADFYANFLRTQGEAKSIAEQRAEQEKSIASQAEKSLVSRESNLMDVAKTRTAEEIANRERLRDILGNAEIQSDLTGLPEEYTKGLYRELSGKTPEGMQTAVSVTSPMRQAFEKRIKIMREVSKKYPDIAGIPLMERKTTEQGYPAWRFPDEWWDQNKDKYTPEQMTSMKNQAKQRAKDYEDAIANLRSQEGQKHQEGVILSQNPLATFLRATNLEANPEVESMITQPERNRLQLIREILGETPMREVPAYVAPQVSFDLAGYNRGPQFWGDQYNPSGMPIRGGENRGSEDIINIILSQLA